MQQWYALYTKPNAEYQVATVMQHHNIQTYLPEIDYGKASDGRTRKPFFPCYLFIKTDFEKVSFSSVQWTPGLKRVVTCDGVPLPLPEDLIDVIRRKLGEIEAKGGWPSHTFQPGQPVRIKDGPFKDMLAIFEGPTRPSQRVHVLLTILGHVSRTQVDVADLEKVQAEVEVPAPKRPRRTRGRGRFIRN